MKNSIILIFFLAFIFGCAEDSSDSSRSSSEGESSSSSEIGYTLRNPGVLKGPFESNSNGFIQELDTNLDPLGKVYNFITNGKFGKFTLNSILTSQYVEGCASGYYFIENTGLQSLSQITLCSYSDIAANPDMIINLLTTLAHKRIKWLIDFSGYTIASATTQAQTEVLAMFNIAPIVGTFDEMDIAIDNAMGGILLAVSVIMQENHNAGELQTLIGDIALDIESDGVLDNVVIKATLLTNSQIVDIAAVKLNVETYYAANGVNITINEYVNYIDSDGDGTINLNDDDLPDALVFTPVNNAELDTEYTSNQQTISGLDSGFTAPDFIGLLYLNGVMQNQLDATGDLLYYGSVQVENDDIIELRTNSSPQYATGKNAEIIFDGVSFSFPTVTKPDTRPEITIYDSGSGLVDGDFLLENANYAINLCAVQKDNLAILSDSTAPLYSTESSDMVDIIDDGVNPRDVKDVPGNTISDSWSGLFGVIYLDNDFSGVVDGPFWTGSNNNGKATDSDRTCDSWTDNTNVTHRGMWGDNSVLDSQWIFNDSTCEKLRHIICVAY